MTARERFIETAFMAIGTLAMLALFIGRYAL